MHENHHLHHPLLPKTTTPSTTTTTPTTSPSPSPSPSAVPGLLPRLVFLLLIGAISLYASHESSKHFNITILNQAGPNTIASKRFNLFYISNDEITRLVLQASHFVENILYPNNTYQKKQVNHVIVTLSPRNLTSSPESKAGTSKRVVVNSLQDHEYVIEINSLVMESDAFKEAMFLAIHQGMVKVWLNGNGNVPQNVVNGIVKYLSDRKLVSNKVLLEEGEDEDEDDVAKYLRYCEMHVEGFVRRLNQDMKDGWRGEMSFKTCKLPSSSSHLINTTFSNMESNV